MIRGIKIIWFSLLIGQIAVFVVFSVIGDALKRENFSEPLLYSALLVSVMSLGAGWILPNLLIPKQIALLPLTTKGAEYRKLVLMRAALWEGANLLAIFMYAISGQSWVPLPIISLIFVLFLLNIPSKKNFEQICKPTPEELNQV
ncbi:MAG: hypothetical protein EAZ55_04635 [Cytophagales bacterium]|nr:MAG: hypothetical protein EAZ55_04635 [Cytophagales bacterium]